MPYAILGLHHVTATADEAQPDLDFCTGALGLRLVKKTVNFDNHHVYHFYYGDEVGAPGTIWTTFPYHGHGVRGGMRGAGQIGTTALSVPVGSLDFWQHRLRARGIPTTRVASRFGDESLGCVDASGLKFELVASDDRREPWTGTVAREAAIRGLHSVAMTVRDPGPTLALMGDLLGWTVVERQGDRTRIGVNGGGPGRTIDLVRAPGAEPGVNGLGTVHHVAMAIGSADEQSRLRDELLARGVKVTDIRDRCYFQSIYFREPGGVLLEVATVSPGFTADEPKEALGSALKLPPWEEPHRADIEAHLTPVRTPAG